MKCLLIFVLCLSTLYGSEVIKREQVVHWIEAMKIKFDGHTYVHFSNNWNLAGSAWFHDPDCERCRKKIIDDVLLRDIK